MQGLDARVANKLTRTFSGLMMLTGALSLVGMGVGMAIMPLVEQVGKFVERINKAKQSGPKTSS